MLISVGCMRSADGAAAPLMLLSLIITPAVHFHPSGKEAAEVEKALIFVPELTGLYVAVCTAEVSKVGAKTASMKVFDVQQLNSL